MQPPSRDPLEPVFPPTSPPMSPLVYRTPVKPPDELPALSNRAIVWAAVVLLVLGLGLAAGLLVAFGDGQNAAQLDAIRTAGTIVLGTGGAAALWLTARRQRTSELSLKQAYAAHAATVADAEARRITDLYGKAADQLGSAQAPTRLAGLYALERLAQDNPTQRQTIVDLLCAYLRMPYEPPRRETEREPVRRPAARRSGVSGVSRPLLGSAARQRALVRLAPPAPRADTATGAATEAEQEHQVRRTAQAILFRHLLVGDKEKPVDTFWSGINLDLTGALLGPANLIGARIVAADFTGAAFTGDVWFDRARFGLDAVFTGVRFADEASMGALRAAEMAPFGMVGLGQVFEDVRAGRIIDDDEVAVRCHTANGRWHTASTALVDLRHAFAVAVAQDVLPAAAAAGVIARLKRCYYLDRTPEAALSLSRAAGLARGAEDRLRRLLGPEHSLKARDARTVLHRVAEDQRSGHWPRAEIPEPAWTNIWLAGSARS